MKLSKRQVEVLIQLAKESASSYGLRASLNTLWALNSKKLVDPVGVGHIAFPQNGKWQITNAGRDALTQLLQNWEQKQYG